MTGWDDPATAAYYDAFCRAWPRYTRANADLVAHARIAPAMSVLDLAAGDGRTAEAALAHLGPNGRIVCVEPSAAMRAQGMRRLPDSRVVWNAALPAAAAFDRILCGAAIWQLLPIPHTLRTLAPLLAPGGHLCFNIPALYLLEPDDPGGGSDPLLLSLPALLWESAAVEHQSSTPALPLDRASIRRALAGAGLRSRAWTSRARLTQDEYADWLKIPVLTDRMLPGLTPRERAHRIDAALQHVDRASWKWERWRGWTAWKPQAV